MGRYKERRWAGRWGSITIVNAEGYFQIAFYFFGVLSMLSFAKSSDLTEEL